MSGRKAWQLPHYGRLNADKYACEQDQQLTLMQGNSCWQPCWLFTIMLNGETSSFQACKQAGGSAGSHACGRRGGTDLDHGKVQVWTCTMLICLKEFIDALQATATTHLHCNVMYQTET